VSITTKNRPRRWNVRACVYIFYFKRKIKNTILLSCPKGPGEETAVHGRAHGRIRTTRLPRLPPGCNYRAWLMATEHSEESGRGEQFARWEACGPAGAAGVPGRIRSSSSSSSSLWRFFPARERGKKTQ